MWLADIDRFASYLRPDELHTAFNFDFMARPWHAADLRDSIDATLAAHAPGRRAGHLGPVEPRRHPAGHPLRPDDSSFAFARKRFGTPTDLELGRVGPRAAALLTAALPGSLYIYQGDELGLDEVEVPLDEIQDPMHDRSGGVDPGSRRLSGAAALERDGRPPFGFSPDGATGRPWLTQPAHWAA